MRRHTSPLSFRHLDTLFSLASQLERHLDRGLDDHLGLDSATVRVLMFIAKHDGAGQRCIANDIIQSTAMPKTSVKKLLRELKKQGFVAESDDAWGSDARRKQLLITTPGREKLDSALEEWDRNAADALSEIGKASVLALLATLDDLHDAPLKLGRLFRLEGTNDWLLDRKSK